MNFKDFLHWPNFFGGSISLSDFLFLLHIDSVLSSQNPNFMQRNLHCINRNIETSKWLLSNEYELLKYSAPLSSIVFDFASLIFFTMLAYTKNDLIYFPVIPNILLSFGINTSISLKSSSLIKRSLHYNLSYSCTIIFCTVVSCFVCFYYLSRLENMMRLNACVQRLTCFIASYLIIWIININSHTSLQLHSAWTE